LKGKRTGSRDVQTLPRLFAGTDERQGLRQHFPRKVVDLHAITYQELDAVASSSTAGKTLEFVTLLNKYNETVASTRLGPQQVPAGLRAFVSRLLGEGYADRPTGIACDWLRPPVQVAALQPRSTDEVRVG
jgi:hypothetical protein